MVLKVQTVVVKHQIVSWRIERRRIPGSIFYRRVLQVIDSGDTRPAQIDNRTINQPQSWIVQQQRRMDKSYKHQFGDYMAKYFAVMVCLTQIQEKLPE